MGVPTIIDHNGVERFLGNNPAPRGLTKAWPTYGDAPETPMIARSLWDDSIAKLPPGWQHPKLPYVHDQDGVGQCNCDATAALAEFCRAEQGLDFIKLSAADLYDRINGGADNGSMLEDAMEKMLREGIGTAATAGTLWRRGMKGAPADERARFKALEVFICPTFDHAMSAAFGGFGIVSGVMWYNNYTPDSEGWLPSGRGGGGGHAVFGYKPASRNGKYGIWHQNSWTAQWGLQGHCVFDESMYRGQVGGWWAVRQMTTESGDIPAPKFD